MLRYQKQKLLTSNKIKCCEGMLGFQKVTVNTTANGSKSVPPLPPRPRRIILIRHGQREGNVDETVYTRVAGPKIGLT
ncbi:hypothetical protein RJ641_001288 [Dillenia turbinata]|uniref:Phosphoglycerate mutase-like protein n=1 Tax=Dillenia turbinata TaxID=194707 RepID=A0AAN8W9Y4_9MAGN